MESNKFDWGKIIKVVVIAVAVIAFGIALWMVTSSTGKGSKDMTYSDYIGFFERNEVASYSLDLGKGKLVITLREQPTEDLNKDDTVDEKDKTLEYTVPDVSLFVNTVQPMVDEHNIAAVGSSGIDRIDYDYKPVSNQTWLLSLIPYVIMAGLAIFLFVSFRRSMSNFEGRNGMGFGKARVKNPADERRKTTFADVAGADEEKEELREIVDFLKDPKRFQELGARIPKGVLLVGPPGTGKTLLARAVAGEAGVPFLSISGSDFVEMYVGVGASRVRDLFEQAKKNAPCIVFVDEIDAVGRQRGTGLGGGHDEREQTLNQLLVEMDGFGANEGVIMIAATNRPDVLDPALTRPGRFDRQIVVNYPDVKGREAILRVHAKGKPLGPDVDLAVIARSTAGFTGADLENLLNEAALLAARRALRSITMAEIEEATVKVIVGTEKRSHAVSEEDKRITAYHEAGHAVVTYYCPTQDPVHQISIIPRGMAAGFTMNLPKEDRGHMSKTAMLEQLRVLLGGRVAEALVMKDICTGASNDLERATSIANSMVTRYGMSDALGPVVYGHSESAVFLGRDFGNTRDYSEQTAAAIDDEIKAILSAAYAATEAILAAHMDQLEAVAQYLLEHEKMDGAQFERMMRGETGEESPEMPAEDTPAAEE